MSQLVRLEGKHTAQTAHCALVRPNFKIGWIVTIIDSRYMHRKYIHYQNLHHGYMQQWTSAWVTRLERPKTRSKTRSSRPYCQKIEVGPRLLLSIIFHTSINCQHKLNHPFLHWHHSVSWFFFFLYRAKRQQHMFSFIFAFWDKNLTDQLSTSVKYAIFWIASFLSSYIRRLIEIFESLPVDPQLCQAMHFATIV